MVGTEVAAGLSLHLAHLTPAASSTFKHAASMPNPKFYELQRLRKSTWDTPRFVRGYGITLDNHLILPAVCATPSPHSSSGPDRAWPSPTYATQATRPT